MMLIFYLLAILHFVVLSTSFETVFDNSNCNETVLIKLGVNNIQVNMIIIRFQGLDVGKTVKNSQNWTYMYTYGSNKFKGRLDIGTTGGFTAVLSGVTVADAGKYSYVALVENSTNSETDSWKFSFNDTVEEVGEVLEIKLLDGENKVPNMQEYICRNTQSVCFDLENASRCPVQRTDGSVSKAAIIAVAVVGGCLLLVVVVVLISFLIGRRFRYDDVANEDVEVL